MTMLIPPAIMIIPQYLLFNWLRWIDSYKPLIIPWFFGGGAFRIFLFRQFIKSIPEELDQAAEIDGCSTLRIFGQIIVPLMMPAVATVAVLGFMDFWNDFFAPFIYLNNVDKDTIVLRLFRIWSDAEGYMREELHTVMAGNVMVTLPAFIIFFIAQKTLHPGHRHHRHQGLTALDRDASLDRFRLDGQVAVITGGATGIGLRGYDGAVARRSPCLIATPARAACSNR